MASATDILTKTMNAAGESASLGEDASGICSLVDTAVVKTPTMDFDKLAGDAKLAQKDYWENYEDVNGSLRAGKTPDIFTGSIIERLDGAFIRAPRLNGNLTVFRGLDSRKMSLAVGDTLTDLGFVSTTQERNIAELYAKEQLFRDLPASKHRASMQTILEIELHGGVSYLPGAVDHAEILLNRGSTFKVIRKIKDAKGRNVVTMELVR